MRTTSSDSSSFVAGLDGLRALAVVAVLAFHLELDGASGGFLGVSLFFTLSGYLITQLLVREKATTDRIDVVGFWVRRLRRLMPGAILLVIAVAVAAVAFDRFPSARLRGDLFAALGYAANWRFMSASTSYADLFTTTPSPVLHFWSLAIEEQFYVFFPLVMAGLLALRRTWAVPLGLLALFGASVAAGLASSSTNLVYYATHTRAAEILAGSLLALWLPLGGFGSESRTFASRLFGSRAVNSIVFGGALAAFLALVVVVETADTWLYSGGLAAVSALSILLIIGVQSPGVVRWLAERSFSVRIGALSYGLYLFHWPIFLLITEDSTALDGWALHSARLAVTGIVAWTSARLLEQPIRARTLLRTPRASLVALVAAIAVTLVAISAVPRTPAQVLAGLDAPEGFVTFGDDEALPELKILLVGSEPSIREIVQTALEDDHMVELVDETDPECSVDPECGDVAVRFEESVRSQRPDLVIVGFGTVDRQAVLASVSPSIDPSSSEFAQSVGDAEFFDATKAYVDEVANSLTTTPSLFLDLGPADAMTAFMEDVALRSTMVSALVAPTAVDIVREVRMIQMASAGQDDRQRIMVIGDSTSYGISVAIDRLEGDRISVLWAGGQNCPIVEVAAVKWWEGVEFDLERCPSLDVEWRAAFESFRPSLVVIAVSVPEQADQRYLGDPLWHAPGSDEYTRVHDEFIARFMAEVTSRGIDVMILDSPTIHGGALGGAPFSSPDRIGIWNAVLARWTELWPGVVVVPWADALTSFEPTPGALRGDGVHLVQDDLDVLVDRALIPVVLRTLFGDESAVEAQAEAIE